MTPATSGRLFEMPYVTWDPASSCWRTSGATSASGSGTFSGTWPTSGSMRDGACFEHPTWGRATDGSACSLLPTPVVNDMGDGKTLEWWRAKTEEWKESTGNGNGHGRSLSIEVRQLPTPTARLGDQRGNPTLLGALLPTPTVTDAHGGRNITANRNPGGSPNVSLGWTLTDTFWTGGPTEPPSPGGSTTSDGPRPPRLWEDD